MLFAVTPTEANRWIAMHFENYRVALGVLTLAAAWPVWTAGVWLVATRMVNPDEKRTGYGQAARPLAESHTSVVSNGQRPSDSSTGRPCVDDAPPRKF